MKGKITSLTVLSVALMVTNVGIQALTAAFLGAGQQRDALFVALSVPLFLNTLMIASFGAVATPAVLSGGSLPGQRRIAKGMLVWLTTAAVVLAGSLYLLRDPLVQLLAPGFDDGQRLRTAGLLSATLGMIPLQSAACILSGYWIARERVLLPSLALLLGNAVIISVVASSAGTLTAANVAWAFLGGATVTFVAMQALYVRDGIGLGGTTTEGRWQTGAFYRQSMPLIGASLVGRSTPLIERHFASTMGPGTISCLGYAGSLLSFLINATTAPAATVYYTRMCRDWNEGRRDELARFLERGSILVVWLSLALGGTAVLSMHELLGTVMPYTKFTRANIVELGDYCTMLMAAYVFLSFSSFAARMFYAAGQFFQAALLDSVATVFYIPFALLLGRRYGGSGLVVATCASAAFLSVLIVFTIQRRLGIAFPRKSWTGLGTVLVLCVGDLALAFVARREFALFFHPLAASMWAVLIYLCGWLIVAVYVPRKAGALWPGLMPDELKT